MKIINKLLNMLGLKRGIKPNKVERIIKEAERKAKLACLYDSFRFHPMIWIDIAATDLGYERLTEYECRSIAQQYLDGAFPPQEKQPNPNKE